MKTILTILALFCLASARGQVDTASYKPCTSCFEQHYRIVDGEPRREPKLNLPKRAGKEISKEGKILIGTLSAIALGALYGKIYGKAYEITR